ncbi:MAG: LytTR family transcriptional regulator [Clostridiales bacterium]|nr:LytTR family transcriptional regulator [Clostridiales bacterium]
MKYRFESIPEGENEVIIRCREITPEIRQLLTHLQSSGQKLIGSKDGTQVVIQPRDILYIESVDGKTFVYTAMDVLRVEYTLIQLEERLNGVNFFRCSKSMILNIDKVTALKSLASNRIDATLQGGEHILISRTYASDFRKRLKGGTRHDP